MASPNTPLDLSFTMASAPHAFLFIPPTSGRVVSDDTLCHNIGLTLHASQVITFNGTSKDNACDPSGDTTVSQRGEYKAKKAGCGAKRPCDGTTVARGGDDEVNTATAGSGTKRPYDAIVDDIDQPYHCRAKTEPGSSQVDKCESCEMLCTPTRH